MHETMRPLILVTNDDGIDATGLRAAAEAASFLGDVLIVAPKMRQTAMGRSFPHSDRQGIIEIQPGTLGNETVPYYAVNGSPAQAVAHGVLEISPGRPALCISGINNGENLGATNLVSGTVGGALEAAAFGIPALAVSVGPEDPDRFAKPYCKEDWAVAVSLIRRLASVVLRGELPRSVAFLNINIPWSATHQTEIRTTTQSRQNQYVCAKPEPRDFSQPVRLPVCEQIAFDILESDSDLYAFCIDRVISVTPMTCDMTARDAVGALIDVHFDKTPVGVMEYSDAD
jgi:5'-nucleotidase